jgi:2-haloalkanoic acid dehalogenase type II
VVARTGESVSESIADRAGSGAGEPAAASVPPAPPHPRGEVIRAVAFDCYGTLLDFDERAFAPAIDGLLRDHGATHTDGKTVWKAWMAHARAHGKQHGRDPDNPLTGPEPRFFSFAESWTAHFEAAFSEAQVEGIAARDATEFLFDLLGQAPPYDEVRQVLDGLRSRGLRIAVASNADDAHLNPALDRHGIRELVDTVISSEGVRSYKPRRPFFDAIEAWSGVTAAEVAYVGDSPYADVTGSRSVGMASYWVRRYEDEEREKLLHHEPTWRFSDLCGLLDVLTGAAS